MVPSVVGATKMAPNDLCLLEFKLCVISSFPEWVGQNFFFFSNELAWQNDGFRQQKDWLLLLLFPFLSTLYLSLEEEICVVSNSRESLCDKEWTYPYQ